MSKVQSKAEMHGPRIFEPQFGWSGVGSFGKSGFLEPLATVSSSIHQRTIPRRKAYATLAQARLQREAKAPFNQPPDPQVESAARAVSKAIESRGIQHWNTNISQDSRSDFNVFSEQKHHQRGDSSRIS
jgi:hypothetical protein